MIRLITLLLSIIIFNGVVLFFLSKYKPKLLWLVPAAAIIFSVCLFLRDISLYTMSEPNIERKLAYYFHNDVSMGLYLIYAPIAGIAIIMTIIAYLLNHNRRKLD